MYLLFPNSFYLFFLIFSYFFFLGDLPDGEMRVANNPNIHCKGYERVGTIIIEYNLYSGKKNGKPFHGTRRVAYLPDNKEGNEVLKLLRIAFDRRLTFTVGDSITTGAKDVIVWNGIHHKTSSSGGKI